MVDSAWAAWPGWHDWRFEPNPSALFWLWWRWRNLLSVCVCGIGGRGVAERQNGGRGEVWSGIVEMSGQVQMHWFRITFLFHFNKRMLPFRENAIPISRFRPNICTIQIGSKGGGGYGQNVIRTRNMAFSSYPSQPYWCLSLSLLSQKWSLSELQLLTDLENILFCWSSLVIWIIWALLRCPPKKTLFVKHCVSKLLDEITATKSKLCTVEGKEFSSCSTTSLF